MENLILNNVEIQPFALHHLEQVAHIHTQVMDGWSIKGLAGDLSNATTHSYVAVCDGKALAFCSYQVIDDAELIFVCTDKTRQGQGIATKLLAETMAALPENITNVVLEVRSQNEKAIGLYNKLGFKKLGIRKNFYSNPADDALVMEYVKTK